MHKITSKEIVDNQFLIKLKTNILSTQIKININNALKNIKKENYKNYIENSYKKKEKREPSKKYSSRRRKLKKYKDE